jgi:hypothetical protein
MGRMEKSKFDFTEEAQTCDSYSRIGWLKSMVYGLQNKK